MTNRIAHGGVALAAMLAACTVQAQSTEPAVAPAAAAAARTAAAPATPVDASRSSRAEPAGQARTPRAGARAIDRLDLDTTEITGNRELPKVMVVVPWKRSDIGDLVGKPVNSLIDEALQPVDREVFRREVEYYGALGPDRPRAATPVTNANAQPSEAGSASRAEK
ncbi:MAG: hypothetical protein O9284_06210 [Steroidobacteraceae bacterium]|jgi:hypothetical protein|nr:hypothetical protein [Steroidobacteraceae bacterium]